MITCILCRRSISLVEVANPESYHGEVRTTCAACAAAAAREFAAVNRTHRLNARDPHTTSRRAAERARHGFRDGSPAREETWALCGRCLGYVESRGIVTLKADGRRLRWLGTDLGHPAKDVTCDACEVRRARRHAVLRVAPSR